MCSRYMCSGSDELRDRDRAFEREYGRCVVVVTRWLMQVQRP
jgi:hypothetical protein